MRRRKTIKKSTMMRTILEAGQHDRGPVKGRVEATEDENRPVIIGAELERFRASMFMKERESDEDDDRESDDSSDHEEV